MRKEFFILLGLLGLHLFFLFNLRFTAWPEMLAYPYLRNSGYLLYKDMIHPYPPLLTMGLSILYKIFGYKLEVVKLVTWFIILVNDVLIYSIIKKLTGRSRWAVVGLLAYVLTQPFLEGNQLWFDLAIVPPVLLATLYLLQKSTPRNVIIAGFALGIATFIKQTAGLYIVFSILYLVYRDKNFKNAIYLLSGPLIIFLTLVVRLITEGALVDFLEWTLINPLFYWSKFPGYVQMGLTRNQLLILVILFLPFLLLILKSWRNFMKDKNFLPVTFYLLLSLILVYPRFSFFHLQLFLALASIAFGYLLSKYKVGPVFIALYFLLIIFLIARPVLNRDWRKETRFWSEGDLVLSRKISEATKDNPYIYLLGPNSSLYVFSQKLPPERWAENFGWYYISPGTEEEVLSRWQEGPFFNVVWQEPQGGNWFDLGTYQPPKITDWIKKNYTRKEEISPRTWLWEKEG